MQSIKNPFIKSLVILSGCLLLVLLVEIIVLKTTPSFVQAVALKKSENEKPINIRVLSRELYSVISSKPLFVENREPMKATESISKNQPAEIKQTKALKANLVGVTLMKNEELAIVVDGKGKYHRLHTNDMINGWIVVEIGTKSVRFTNKGETKTLTLDKKKENQQNTVN